LAVVAVVVYHFGGGWSSWLPGGFLGVDVFFVLSGYLITGLLLAEYERRGRIDLLGFWVRRLRRLLPALVVMLVVVCAWVWWAAAPDDYPKRRLDVFWTLGYLANWRQINTSETYFAAYSSASPLRHAWSLAVEEQFYLVWPAMVLGLLRLARTRLSDGMIQLPVIGRVSAGRVLVGVAALLGVVMSLGWVVTQYDVLYPSRAYYSTQGRVQELFVGVVLAVVLPRVRRVLRPRAVSVAGGLGLGGVLAAIVWLPDSSAFYYYGGALCVCVAVAAVIAAVEVAADGVPARIFSWRPAVALGRISYGVYLWHWPLVVAIPISEHMSARAQLQPQLTRALLTLVIATASYHLLEQPVLRNRGVLGSPARVLVTAVTVCALVVAVAIPATALPGTLAEQMREISDQACPHERIDHLEACSWPLGANLADKPVRLAVMGDSTARALKPGLDDWAARTGSSWVQAAWKQCTASGLMPVSGIRPGIAAKACAAQAPHLIDQTLAGYHPAVVLVGEYFAQSRPLLVDGKMLQPGSPEHYAALRSGYLDLVDRVARYRGRVVFLELPPPGIQLGRVIANGRPAGRARSPVLGNISDINGFNAVLRSVAVARPASARAVSVTDLVCPGGSCRPVHDGMLIRADGLHYTTSFSRYLTPQLLRRSGVENKNDN
jgi:peptidoglycan/LPS O-acetylase OafA/YrhL